MYKVILADDEILILKMLRKLICWEDFDIEIAGEFTDGKDAFKAILEKQPDIVITDIKMSGMTGLEIVRNCSKARINTIFLLISGHAEFEYAHMAIRYGVENYLLKPINKQELENNLQRICMRLNSQRMATENKLNLENQIQFNKEILNGQFLNNMLFIPNWLTTNSCPQLLQDYQLSIPTGDHYILALKATVANTFTLEQYTLLLKQISGFGLKLLKKSMPFSVSTYSQELIYFLIVSESNENFTEKVQEFFEEMKSRFFEYCSLSLGISTPASDLFHISRYQAEEALILRYRLGLNKIYNYNHFSLNKTETQKDIFKERFSHCIETLNFSDLHTLMEELKQYATNPSVDIRLVLNTIQQLCITLYNSMKLLYGSEDPIQTIPSRLNFLIENSSSFQNMLINFEQFIKQLLAKFQEEKSSEKYRHIMLAKEYINAHLDENITLNDIAGIVYMNPTYYSDLFKKVTGQTFSDYLETQRINKAKLLLKDYRYSISDIGRMVGYKNARYFSKVFYKKMNIKPSEYRKMNLP